jgi:hypothetical protein
MDGIEMNRFAARWYDPTIARWHAPDPLEQMHSPYVALCNDPVQQFLTAAQRRFRNANPDAIGANYVDPDGRAGIHLSDWDKKTVLGFARVIAGGAAMVGIGQALQGVSGISQAFQAIRGVLSAVSTISSGVSLLQSISSMASKFGVGGDVTASWQDDLMGEIRSHSGVGMAFGGVGDGGPAEKAEGKPTKPRIYLVNELKNVALDIPTLIKEMQNILALNGFANMYDIVEITHQQALDMNRNKTFRTCDAIHSIKDGMDFFDVDNGNTELSPFDSTPNFFDCYTNVAICENVQNSLRSCRLKSSLEYAVAIVTMHEISHQYTLRMYSYLYGAVPILPPWVDAKGHINSIPNLLNEGHKWFSNLQTDCGQITQLLRLGKADQFLFGAFYYCSQLNLNIGDYQAWRREFMKYCRINWK